MKKKYRLYVALLIACIPFLYLAFQTYFALHDTYTMQVAMRQTMEKTGTFTGIAVRNEYSLTYGGNSLIGYSISQGERVANYGRVAVEYSSAQQVTATTQMQAAREKIEALQSAQAASNSDGTNLENILTQVKDSTYNLITNLDDENYSAITKAIDALAYYTNFMQIAMGEEETFTPQIEALQQEYSALSAQAGTPLGYIYAREPGYFFHGGDGYTGTLTIENVDALTPAQLKDLVAQSEVPATPANQIGGVQVDHSWNFYITFDAQASDKFIAGRSVKVSFETVGAQELSAKIVSVEYSEEQQLGIAKLEFSSSTAATVGLRVEKVEVIFNTTTGLYISKDAKRMVDGVTGVYVRHGDTVQFKQITPIYEDDECMLVPVTKTDVNEVGLYDEIFISGKDLYDGKILS